ncbi:MAG: hypothetical protein PVG33_04595 [Chloroflexota bacterium]|jgi:hypothetical protein
MAPMETFITSPKSQRWLVAMVVVGLLIFILALSMLMVPYSSVIEERGGRDLTCLQIPFTRSRAAAILNSYDGEARAAARSLHLPGDLIFPIGYALLYAGLIGLVIRRLQGRWLRLGLLVMLFPLAAMVLDWMENYFILRMLAVAGEQSVGAIPAWMPALGGLAGALKYLLLSLLTPLFGLSAILWSVTTRRPPLSPGLIVIYLAALVMFCFSLFQLFTEVPPCLGPL